MKTIYSFFLVLFCFACLAIAEKQTPSQTQQTQMKQFENSRRINFDQAKNQITAPQNSRANRPPKPILFPVDHSRGRGRTLDQGGDNCSNATVIHSLPFCATGSTLGFTNDFPEEIFCVGADGGRDVYYRYTPSQDELITISLCGTSSFRTIAVLYEDGGNCSGIDNIHCNNNSCGVEQACLQDVEVFAGTPYIIVVDGDWGESGNYLLNVTTDGICGTQTCGNDPAGEDCASAGQLTVVPNGTIVTGGTTVGANATCEDYCDWNSFSPDVFYYFTLAECRKIAIKLESGDSHVSVYPSESECCVNPILCNDDHIENNSLPPWDNPAQHPIQDYDSYVAAELPAGTYYIRCGMYDVQEAPFTLTIYDNGSCSPLQGGENCQTATVIPGIPYCATGTTVGYASDYSEQCGADNGESDVVYVWTPTENVVATVSLCGSSFNTALDIYESPFGCNEAYWYACDLTSCSGGASCLSGINFWQGYTYYIVVDGTAGSQGTYLLNITEGYDCASTPCGNGGASGDNCSNPFQILSFPSTFTGSTVGFSDDYNACNGEGDGAADVVFSYTPTQDTYVDITTCNQTEMNSTITVYQDGDFNTPYDCYRSSCISFSNNTLYSNAQLFCVLFEAGHTYCVVLDGRNPGNEGNYGIVFEETTVQACNMNDYCGTLRETEPNNTACPPQLDIRVLHCGDTLYGNICSVGDKDYFRVATPEDTVSLTGIEAGPNCDAIFTGLGIAFVWTPPHLENCYEFAPCNQCAWFTGDSGPDTTAVVVEGMGGCKTGPYRIYVYCEPRASEPCDPAACTSAPTLACNTPVTASSCSGCNIIPSYYENGNSGRTHGSSGKDLFYKLIATTAGNYTINVSTDSTAAWNQNVQFMLFTDCTRPKTTCIISQDQNDYFTQVDGTRNTETATVFLTPGTYYIGASISDEYPYGTNCGNISVQVICPVSCLPADSLTIKWNQTSQRSELRWYAPQAGLYQIYSTVSTTLNTTPPGAGWTLETTQNVSAGQNLWTDPAAAVLYKRYLAVHSCP